MALSSSILGTLGKITRGISKNAALLIADGLMDEKTANALSALQGDVKNLKFHKKEIEVLARTFKNTIPSAFPDVFKFSDLIAVDNGSRLVSQIKFKSGDLLPNVIDFYNLENSRARNAIDNDFIYLMIRKSSTNQRRLPNNTPHILKFLEKAFNIEISIVASINNNGSYSNYRNVISLGHSETTNQKFISFFDLIPSVDKALAGMNALIQHNNLNPIDNQSYINSNTARTIFIGSGVTVKTLITNRLINDISRVGQRRNEFGLRKVFDEADGGRILDITPIKNIEGLLLASIRDTINRGQRNEAFGNPYIKITSSGSLVEFEFMVRGSQQYVMVPKTNMILDLKTAKAKAVFSEVRRGMLLAPQTKNINIVPKLDLLRQKMIATTPMIETHALRDFGMAVAEAIQLSGVLVIGNLNKIL